MQKTTPREIGRREWLGGVVPACAAVCLSPCQALGDNGTAFASLTQQEAHPFEQELKNPMTYRELTEASGSPLSQVLSREGGAVT